MVINIKRARQAFFCRSGLGKEQKVEGLVETGEKVIGDDGDRMNSGCEGDAAEIIAVEEISTQEVDEVSLLLALS